MKNSLRTLLAATDLSAPSRFTAQRAAMLAKESGAKLELVHVLQQNMLDEVRELLKKDGEALQENIRSQTKKELSQLADYLAETLGRKAGCHLVEGLALEGIIAQVEALDADLLIIGAHGGASYARQLLLGATAERLLRMTLRPVLTVKQPPRVPYQSVLVPIDFSPWSIGAIQLAQMVAPQAELILMHAYEVPFVGKLRRAGEKEETILRYRDMARQKARSRLSQIVSDAGLDKANWRSIVKRGDAGRRILEQEEKQGADLIVLGKHGLGMVEELLFGGRTNHILAHAHCDVLVAPYSKVSSIN
jgi:nucleotide-binding universal stress UspA family protein